MNEQRLWLVRHAESTWNAVGRWQGQADPPLSARGREQAEALARELRDEGLEVLVASDLTRTSETARIVGQILRVELRFDVRLREIDAGSWSGLDRHEIGRRDAAALERFDSGDPDAPAGGAETRSDVGRRARAALQEILPGLQGSRTGIVSHGGLLQALVPGLQLANAGWRAVDRALLVGREAAA